MVTALLLGVCVISLLAVWPTREVVTDLGSCGAVSSLVGHGFTLSVLMCYLFVVFLGGLD